MRSRCDGYARRNPDAVGREVLETNFFGMMNVTRAVLPLMRAQKSGRILLMTAIVGFANHAAFSLVWCE